MANAEIVRSVCLFTEQPNQQSVRRVNELAEKVKEEGFDVQTRRICSPEKGSVVFDRKVEDGTIFLGRGPVPLEQAVDTFPDIIQAKRVSLHADMTDENITPEHTKMLFKLMKQQPDMMFNFAYSFNTPSSSPYFPSARYEQDGFSIGLQSTNLAEGCYTIDGWLGKTKQRWEKLDDTFGDHPDYLGIDSSIAPFADGNSSLVHFVKRLGSSEETAFSDSVTTNTYMQMTEFIKKENPKPVGLNGLMLPCLEDFELADEYEKGKFPIERNVFLSLHSGLGIDTYPIGMDEDPQRVVDIMKLTQGLSNKYEKPLAIRFVADGKAKIGEKTDFKSEYLKDVVVRKL